MVFGAVSHSADAVFSNAGILIHVLFIQNVAGFVEIVS